MQSMTGYGKGVGSLPGGVLTVEVRSVNHRYGEVTVKLPRLFYPFEQEIKRVVGERLQRGKIDVLLQLAQEAGESQCPRVNLPLARSWHAALTELQQQLGLAGEISLGLVAGQRDVLVSSEAEPSVEEWREALLAVVREATAQHEAMRRREGEALLAEFRGRRIRLAELQAQVAERSPQVVAELHQKLRDRVATLLGSVPVDEARLAQEMALLADRCDITEELVRFSSHLTQFDLLLASKEPVGRKLDFLLQELNREVNTIGSKANDAALAALVVELKAELEKIREQAQNVE